jgi:hypothetical protein
MTSTDFRATASSLAGQLQAAARTAIEMTDALQRAEQTIELLKKYMTPTQQLHAHLEIDALPVRAATSFLNTVPEQSGRQPLAHA